MRFKLTFNVSPASRLLSMIEVRYSTKKAFSPMLFFKMSLRDFNVGLLSEFTAFFKIFHDNLLWFPNCIFKNSNFFIRPEHLGLTFPYQHPEFKNVNEKVLLIENLYFKKSHLIAYKVFNPTTYDYKTVWSMDFYEYLNTLEIVN